MSSLQKLLHPYKMGDLQLKNRVIMASMTRSRADNEALKPTQIHQLYYKQRSTAGLIISEGSPVSSRAIGYISVHSEFFRKNRWKVGKK